MSRISIETFLATLYADRKVRESFLAAPEVTARAAGLDDNAVAALCAIDRPGLIMAARSYANKRAMRRKPRRTLGTLLFAFFSGNGIR